MFVKLLHTQYTSEAPDGASFYKIGTWGKCACADVIKRKRRKGRKIIGSPDYLAWLASTAPDTSSKIRSFLKREAVRMTEEINSQITFGKLAKADKLTAAQIKAIIDGLDFSRWQTLIGIIEPDLLAAFQTNAKAGWQVIGFDAGEDIVALTNERAVEWARNRAAEMVGMRYNKDGELVENPNKTYAITETTREDIRNMTSDAVNEGLSSQDFADELQDSFAFSEERSMMIARTELAGAHVEGNMVAWQESGEVQGTQWILGSEHDMDDECNENAEAGVIPLGEEFPSGDTGPPAHPNCVCDVIPVLIENSEAS